MEDLRNHAQAVPAAAAGAPAPGNDARPVPADLREWLSLVEANGQLCRVQEPVNLKEELGAITYMVARGEGGPALLFDRFDGLATDARVVSNMLGSSRERFALAMGIDPALGLTDMIRAVRRRMGTTLPPVTVAPEQAPVNARILTGDDIDVTKFPAPQLWPRDGGDYIGTTAVTITRDPETGDINAGVYRQMRQGPQRIGIYCSPGKHGLRHWEATWKQGRPCEVVVAYGVDPILFMVGSQSLSVRTSELAVAGGLRGTPIPVTEGLFTSLPIPAHAEMVVEGEIRPGDLQQEGPLGEFTGYYGRPSSPQPVITVKAVHSRQSPIIPAALMADYPACEIGTWYAIFRSASLWDDLDRLGIPGITGVFAHPAAASGWGLVTVSIKQQYAGHAAQVLALAAQSPATAYYTKWIVVVDEDVDPTDINQVLWALSTRCHPSEDIDILRNTWSTGLDPSQYPPEARPYGSKALINACKPHRYLSQFPVRTALRRSVYDQVVSRWTQLGLPKTPPSLEVLE